MKYLKKRWLYIVTITLALITFILAYRPTLFNFFISDDFHYFVWMNGALHCPDMLINTYWTPWIGPKNRILTTDSSLFYRPLFASILFLECKLIGLKSLPLRLVNLGVELATGVMLGFTVIGLNKTSTKKTSLSSQQAVIWAFFAAILFILFPLHSASVNWIADGVDIWVTLFSLVSISYYIRWRNNPKLHFFILSVISLILALLTKEMAVAIPPTLLTYELLFGSQSEGNVNDTGTNSIGAKTQFLRAISRTWLYWLIFAMYFCIRKVILGDFTAGYPDNLCNPYSIAGWLKGLYIIFVPLDTFITGKHLFIYRAWHVALFFAVLLTTIASFRTSNHQRKIVYFLIIWFFLCLAPVYKVFPTSMNYFSGYRVVYLASAPICVLLTYGIAFFCVGNRFSLASRFITMFIFGTITAMLYANNLAFAQAGHLSNKIVQAFKAFYQNHSGDPFVYVTGLPKLSDGIYIPVGKLLNGITNTPMLDRGRANCSWIESNDQYTSVGFLKQSAEKSQQYINLLYWDSESETLKPVLIFSQDELSKNHELSSLKQIVSIPFFPHTSQPDAQWLSDGTLDIVSNEKHSKFTIIELNLEGLPCWQINFLAMRLRCKNPENLGSFRGAQFFFVNDIVKDYSKDSFENYFNNVSCYANIKSTKKEQEMIFPLRNLPAWSMGGKCHSVRIVLPTDCSFNIEKIWVPEAKTLMPLVHLETTPGSQAGQIQLNRLHPMQDVQHDANSIIGCKRIILQVVANDYFYPFLNSCDNSKLIVLEKISSQSYGTFSLSRSQFPSQRKLYRAHIKALDANGNQLGFPSDSFFINIDS